MQTDPESIVQTNPSAATPDTTNTVGNKRSNKKGGTSQKNNASAYYISSQSLRNAASKRVLARNGQV